MIAWTIALAALLTVGLGASRAVDAIGVTWPGGRIDKLAGQPSGQTLVIEEGRGIVNRMPFGVQPVRSPAGPQ
jgi:ASPIC/UnbV protein